VTAADDVDASCCRLYRDSNGRSARAPDFEQIRAALLRASVALPTSGARPLLENASSVLPSVGLALLPKLTCAACWPAYGWLLGALGLNFLDYTPYLLPLMAAFLAMAVVSLAYRARTRRGYGPLLVGTIAATLMLAGKFAFDSDLATYAGAALLTAAFVWNVWPPPKYCHAAR
jgi:mercuric ion transport protein